ncbi:FtsX-like permease family protein [Paenibacillus sp. UNC499MF]|uniref:FtsX-like permease family protein n=1 Tax=Paenibacillus sp. UNC499MF TaxID=1502751 RepID=UPI00089FE509|nr:ABC transporter permease [Paenibacillus sp. UNC499MF]SEG47311.1 putative ABC transport system permease protein [Paenibacillus sp. UNC499MF]
MNFPRFAFNNVKRNGRAYFAYFLSSAFMVMIFFTYAVFIYHPQLDRSLMGPMTRAGMQAAAYVVFIFSFFFVLYSISMFLKSRNKEFGILTILGADSGQVNRLIFLENMLVGGASIVSGIFSGVFLSKLFLLISAKMTGMEDLPFYWPVRAILLTAVCFALLFLVISVLTLFFIRKNNVLELLNGSKKPKKEPKLSIWLCLLGFILLAAGFLALRIGEVEPANIFIAAVAGIAGTYLFYSQLTVLAVRAMKRSRKRVWRGTRLLWVSEFSYKLKDNARMLFLVTVVTSVSCMSAGFVLSLEQENRAYYLNNPAAIQYTSYDPDNADKELRVIDGMLKDAGAAYKRLETNSFYALVKGKPGSYVDLVSVSEYNKIADAFGKGLSRFGAINTGEAAVVYTKEAGAGDIPEGPVVLKDLPPGTLQVKQTRNAESLVAIFRSGAALVLEDQEFKRLKSASEQDSPFRSRSFVYLVPEWNTGKLPASDSPESVTGDKLLAWHDELQEKRETDSFISTRAHNFLQMQQGTSLFRFIGVFIAFIFSISTASFLYFKLHTELAADSQMYRALSKIGLSAGEMRKSATVQIALLFFMPIVVSTVQTIVVLGPVMNRFGVANSLGPALMVSAAFLGAQAVYFLIVRSRYVRTLNKWMV